MDQLVAIGLRSRVKTEFLNHVSQFSEGDAANVADFVINEIFPQCKNAQEFSMRLLCEL